MASKVHRRKDGSLDRIDVICDVCGKVESDSAIMLRGGLLKMGWLRAFDAERCEAVHYCPEHHPKEEPSGD